MSNIPDSVKSASQNLMKSLRTVNEAHLANFSRKTVPEIELVKHVRKELREILGQKNVFVTVKGLHEHFGEIVFLKQPDVDLCFRYSGKLYGVEFKLLGGRVSFYSGLEEAIAYSTYGIDYSWIVHFFRKSFKNAKNYERWMKYVIEQSNCLSVGYICSSTKSSRVVVYPKQPFPRKSEPKLEEIVSKVREKLFLK